MRSTHVRKSQVSTESSTQQETIQNLADALASSLTTVAASTPKSKPKEKEAKKLVTRKYNSSFFFSLKDEYLEQERMRRMTEVKVLPSSTKAVVDASKELEKILPSRLEPNIEEVRDFFLHDLGPKTLASMSGLDEACAIIEQITGASVDRNTVDSFRRIMVQGSRLKMVQFVSKYLDLSEQSIKDLMTSVVNQTRPKDGISTIMIPGIEGIPPQQLLGEGDMPNERVKPKTTEEPVPNKGRRRYPF